MFIYIGYWTLNIYYYYIMVCLGDKKFTCSNMVCFSVDIHIVIWCVWWRFTCSNMMCFGADSHVVIWCVLVEIHM